MSNARWDFLETTVAVLVSALAWVVCSPAFAVSIALPPLPSDPLAVLHGEAYVAGTVPLTTIGDLSSTTSSIVLGDWRSNGGTSGGWQAKANGGSSPSVVAWAGAGNLGGSTITAASGIADADITYYFLAAASGPLASPPASVDVTVNYTLETSGFEQHEYLPIGISGDGYMRITGPGGGQLYYDWIQRSGGVNINYTKTGQADISIPYGEWVSVRIHAHAFASDGYGWTGLKNVGEVKTVIDPTIIINPNMPDAALFEIVQAGIASPVPIPAAVWLFGSGLLGLVGVARKKKSSK